MLVAKKAKKEAEYKNLWQNYQGENIENASFKREMAVLIRQMKPSGQMEGMVKMTKKSPRRKRDGRKSTTPTRSKPYMVLTVPDSVQCDKG